MHALNENPTHDFDQTQTGDPHALRRKDLLRQHPAIRSLFGHDRRTAAVTIALVLAQLSLAACAGRGGIAGRWYVVLLGSWWIGAPLTHWLAMAIHETSHRLAARTPRGNVAIALIANPPMVLPLAITFNRYHLDHHRRLGVLGGDTDLPIAFERAHIGNSGPRKLVWLFLHPLVYVLRGATFARLPNRGELLNAALILTADFAIYQWLGGAALAYLSLSFFFALGLHPVAGHFIHEHYTFTPGQETSSYYGPLNWITFNVGYHNEHHDFMNIPGWRLPELRRMVPDYSALASDTSWTQVLWRFVTDSRLGYSSRIVRNGPGL